MVISGQIDVKIWIKNKQTNIFKVLWFADDTYFWSIINSSFCVLF